MATVTVIYGQAYDGKNAAAFQRCLTKVRAHAGQTCLYIVRAEARAQQLRAQTLAAHGGYFAFPVTTLPNFLRSLYRQQPGNKRLLNTFEQQLLIQCLLRQHAADFSPSSAFRQIHRHPGLIGKLQATLTELRRVGITTPEMLAAHLQAASGQQRRVHEELQQVCALYHKALMQNEALDETGLFFEMGCAAANGQLDFTAHLPQPELLVLEGYAELTPPEQQIVTALCAHFAQTIITFDCPFNPYLWPESDALPKAYRIFDDFARYLTTAGCSVRAFSPPPAIPPAPSDLPWQRDPATVTLTAYQNRAQEIAGIAQTIRRLHRKGVIAEFQEVGVVFPQLETYAGLIREIFPLYGLPFNVLQGYPLASATVVATIFRLLDAIGADYNRVALRRLFASPFVQFAPDASTSASPDDLPPRSLDVTTFDEAEELAEAAGIQGGRMAWEEKLTRYRQEYQQQHPNETLPPLFAFIAPLVQLIDVLAALLAETPAPFAVFVTRLRQCLHRLHLPRRLLQQGDPTARDHNLSAFQRLMELLEMLQREFGPTPLTFGEFAEVLRQTALGQFYAPPETRADALMITGRFDAIQVQFRYLFFGGLVEKDFPGQDRPNVFFAEQELERLGLPTYQQKLRETAYLFYLHARNPTEHLYVSYPQQEDETDLLPATYLDRLLPEPQQRRQRFSPPSDDGDSIEDSYVPAACYQWVGRALTRDLAADGAPSPQTQRICAALQAQHGTARVAHFLNGWESQRRRRAHVLSAFDGQLDSGWARERLRGHYRQHVYAVTEFDVYARCPMQYFFRRVLQLTPRLAAQPTIAALDIGNLLHRIVARFYSDFPATPPGVASSELTACRKDSTRWLSEAAPRLARIAAEELQAYPFAGVYWDTFRHTLLAGLPGLTEDATTPYQGLLAGFLAAEANDPDRLAPCYCEARFGISGRENADAPFGWLLDAAPYRLHGQTRAGATRSLRLMGMIDRIDCAVAPSPAESAARRKTAIYDYKTGRLPSARSLLEGRSFQLPLYILAAQACLGANFEVLGGGYYQLATPDEIGKKGVCASRTDAGYVHGRNLLETADDVQQLLTDYANRAVQIDQQIQQGAFAPTTLGPSEAGCGYCDYRQICRVDHQRMKLAHL